MARGVRKSPVERLHEELKKTQDVIEQYKSAIKTQEEKLRQLQNEIQMEEFKELSEILQEKNMSISELKDILAIKEEGECPKDE